MDMRLQTRIYIICAALLLGDTPFAGSPGTAHAQVSLPQLNRPLPGVSMDDRIGSRVRRSTESVAESTDTLDEEVPDEIEQEINDTADTVGETATAVAEQAGAAVDEVGDAAGVAAQQVVDTAAGALRVFALGADPGNWPVELDVLVVLVDTDAVDALNVGGVDIVSERTLAGLGKTLVTLRRSGPMPVTAILDDLRNANPEVAADYNHVYRFATEPETTDVESDTESDRTPAESLDDGKLRIGIIDSAVQAEHLALQNIGVQGRDFVSNEGTRPVTHGTAVASLIARSSDDTATVYSASVFFQTAQYAPGATTESLVAALDWLAQEKVDVINMSLAGPHNALLQQALLQLKDAGPPVVAAVGNNGPSGEPLFPAAYEGIIGVTAVDRDSRVFRYANRGEHVDFAARGVNVKVADTTTGGWRIESGTSMASPHIAVVISRILRANGVQREALMSWLMSGAEDLGRRGFDPIFGHGLVTQPPMMLSQE